MQYEEWRATAVTCSDIRCFGIDGFMDINTPVPGVAFMVPKIVMGRIEEEIERWDCTGYITRDDNRGLWDVQIENTEQSFMDFEKAARYLWDNWVKDECFSEPDKPLPQLYRLMQFDEFGTMEVDTSGDWCQCKTIIRSTFQDNDQYDRAIEDLSKPGCRFHEFTAGHVVLIPIERIN